METGKRAVEAAYERTSRFLRGVARVKLIGASGRILADEDDLVQAAMLGVVAFVAERQTKLGTSFRFDETLEREARRYGSVCLAHALIDQTRRARVRRDYAALQADPPVRCEVEEMRLAQTLIRELENRLRSKHKDRFLETLGTMLETVGDADFSRSTLARLSGLDPKQLARLAEEVRRRRVV